MAETPPPAPPPPALVAFANSHPGKQRDENEDAFGLFPDERLFIVADGMGGRAAGAVAARIAVDSLESFFRAQHAAPRTPWPFPINRQASLGANLLYVGTKVANKAIRDEAAADPAKHRMAATLAALAVGETHICTVHVGDVRAYRLREGKLQRLTRDHSILEEMRAARPEMTDEEASTFAHKNVVTKALGSKDEVEPTVYTNTFAFGDTYLLCCDGLWGSVPDERIADILNGNNDLEHACQKLVDAANDAGGPDNVTALLVRVLYP